MVEQRRFGGMDYAFTTCIFFYFILPIHIVVSEHIKYEVYDTTLQIQRPNSTARTSTRAPWAFTNPPSN